MDGDATNRRKSEAIDVIRGDAETDRHRHYFDMVRQIHRRCELNYSTSPVDRVSGAAPVVSPADFLDTGGDSDLLRTINRNLAEAAEATGVAMGVGSQRIMFENEDAQASFEIRDVAPNILLFANLGRSSSIWGTRRRTARRRWRPSARTAEPALQSAPGGRCSPRGRPISAAWSRESAPWSNNSRSPCS
jgi:isopentenyl diphosphate isomerase/L-lactate dehydrogenase-like FMN-dependent dehydrogenase